jgi:hypothetical protein
LFNFCGATPRGLRQGPVAAYSQQVATALDHQTMSFAAAVIILMQANTAAVDPAQKLEPGRWVSRTSSERGTGLGGISATLQSNDRQYRLVVRCDFSYEFNLSIQFLRHSSSIPATALPVSLTREPGKAEIILEWEQTPAGVFARDGANDSMAMRAAEFLLGYYGDLHVEARDQADRSLSVVFDSAAGHQAISRTIEQCAAVPSE